MNSSTTIPPIPVETKHAARAVYSRENLYLIIGDYLAAYIQDLSQDGIHMIGLAADQQRLSLAMITLFQYIEHLSDFQAVEASRVRLDWKYALHLSMYFRGFPLEALDDYRQKLGQRPVELQKFQAMLDRLQLEKPLAEFQNRCFEAITVLNEVSSASRINMLRTAMQNALETLTMVQPDWLGKISLPHWYARYLNFLPSPYLPAGNCELQLNPEMIRTDIDYLLECLVQDAVADGLQLEEVQGLFRTLHKQQLGLELYDPVTIAL